jgi:hypothetical protein
LPDQFRHEQNQNESPVSTDYYSILGVDPAATVTRQHGGRFKDTIRSGLETLMSSDALRLLNESRNDQTLEIEK